MNNDWRPMSILPEESGLYLVCARTGDKDMPLRAVAYYWADSREWGQISTYWSPYLEFWCPFPKTPFQESKL